ncbi:MAG: thioredoxin [Deltaproteobacteria bacterium]|nr:thioredoxin [Deltaproteobacteria bacterium]
MASDKVSEFTDGNFDAEVLRADVPTLVDFWAVWCGPCRAIAPAVESLAGDYNGKVKFGKLNIDDHPLVPTRYEIKSIPTLLMFKGGKVVGQIVGAVPKGKIDEMIKKAL